MNHSNLVPRVQPDLLDKLMHAKQQRFPATRLGKVAIVTASMLDCFAIDSNYARARRTACRGA
jgi:hypothetical protein